MPAEPLNTRIEGLTFDGAGVKIEQENVNWADNVDITNCVLQNAPAGGGLASMVYVSSGARNCEFTGNVFRDIDALFGILANSIENFQITNNTFDTMVQAIQVHNFQTYGATGVVVSNNRFVRLIEKAMEIKRGRTIAFEGLRIENNVISDFRENPNDPGNYSHECMGISVIIEQSRNTVIANNKIFGKLVGSYEDYRLPVHGIEISAIGGRIGADVVQNLVEGFMSPVSVWAQGGAPMNVDGNRVRGIYDSGYLPTGVQVHVGQVNITNHNGSQTVETNVIVGPDLIVRGTGSSDTISINADLANTAEVTFPGTLTLAGLTIRSGGKRP